MIGGLLDGESSGERSQLVLAAAAVIALALAPVVLAYLQLGYHEDVAASAGYDDDAANAARFLERGVHEASDGVPGEYGWDEREAAVRAVRERLAPRLQTLSASQVDEGVAYSVRYNQTAASLWSADNCPGGRGRDFGTCSADRGVVVQERAGETHVVAVAFDATVTTERGRTRLTLLVRAISGN